LSDSVILTATRLMEIVPHEGIHEYKIYDGDDDEAFYYYAETRRNVGPPLWASCYSSTHLPVNCKISIRIFLIL